LNRYGQPNFRIAWAQTETRREGGEWDNEDGYFVGYRDCYLGDGRPHWMLLQWIDAGMTVQGPHFPAMSPRGWHMDNLCPKTGLQILGEYPYHGSYQVAHNLCAKWFDDAGRLQIYAFPLSNEIVDMMVPIVKASMAVSVEAKLRFLKDERDKDDAEFAKQVDAAYHSAKLPNSVRGAQWVEDKVRQIEKHFNAALVMKMRRDKFSQGRPHANFG